MLLWLIITMTKVANAIISINTSYVLTVSHPLEAASDKIILNNLVYFAPANNAETMGMRANRPYMHLYQNHHTTNNQEAQ